MNLEKVLKLCCTTRKYTTEGYQILSALAVGYPEKPLVEREVVERIVTDIL